MKEKFARNVLEVKRVSNRLMSLKLGMINNDQIVSGYAPQVGYELKEKQKFWSELDLMQGIPRAERVVSGADFNGHNGKGNRGDEHVFGMFLFRLP